MSEASKSSRRKRRAVVVQEGGAATPPSSTAPCAPTADTKPRVEIRSMAVVARAVTRAQGRALVYERLAIEAANLFRGNDFRPPRLLLKLPGGGPFPVEVDDVMEIEGELAQMASEERLKVTRLLASPVHADPAEVDLRREVSGKANVPVPEGETVVENPTARSTTAAATTSAGRTRV
jgi:hypothetical protein